MNIPIEQSNKLESFIKHWVNPSIWYESKKEGLKRFLLIAKHNEVKLDEVEFVIKKDNNGQMICEPEIINKDNSTRKEAPKRQDIDRLSKYLEQFPKYNNRIENGENVIDIVISVINKYSELEKKSKYIK